MAPQPLPNFVIPPTDATMAMDAATQKRVLEAALGSSFNRLFSPSHSNSKAFPVDGEQEIAGPPPLGMNNAMHVAAFGAMATAYFKYRTTDPQQGILRDLKALVDFAGGDLDKPLELATMDNSIAALKKVAGEAKGLQVARTICSVIDQEINTALGKSV